jgi:hypothetical protein
VRFHPARAQPCGAPGHASFGCLNRGGPSICVRGPKRCGRPGGIRGCNTWPRCERRLAGVHGSRCGRTGAAKKKFCRVTTRGRKLIVASGLGRGLRTLTARSFGGGALGFDFFVLAAFGLATRGLPAADQLLALGLLAIALVPAFRLIPPATPSAMADSWPRLAPTGLGTCLRSRLSGAHGSLRLPRVSPRKTLSSSGTFIR